MNLTDVTPLITLDTSCVSALANRQDSNDPDEVLALEKLSDLGRDGRIHLQLTISYNRDFERWADDEGRADRLRWLQTAPEMPRAPGVFRLDVSALDGGDVLGDNADAELDQQLRKILRPTLLDAGSIPPHEQKPGTAARRFSDIDHLIAHRRSGATHFVTLDRKTILGRRGKLAELGIEVCLPSEALAALD